MHMSERNLSELTIDQAAERLRATIAEGRLVQGSWHGERDGRHLACILGSFDESIRSEADCPAQIMPAWMTYLTVRIFDGLSNADYLPWADEYAKSMRTWGMLDGAAWDRAHIKFKVSVIRHALESARKVSGKLPDGLWAKVESACNSVIAALEGSGDLKAAADAHWADAAAARKNIAYALLTIIAEEAARARGASQ